VSQNPYEQFGQQPDDPGSQHPSEEIPSDAKNIAMLCHLLGLFPGLALGVAHVAGPLILWLWKRDDHPFISDQGKESINFQISVSIYALLIAPLCCFLIGIPLLIVLAVSDVVLVIIAAMKAGSGEWYRYPMCLRLLK